MQVSRPLPPSYKQVYTTLYIKLTLFWLDYKGLCKSTECSYPCKEQFVQGRPGQQAEAKTEPQTSVCRSKAMKQYNTLILPDLFFLGYVLTDDTLIENVAKSHLKGMAAPWQPRLWGNGVHNRKYCRGGSGVRMRMYCRKTTRI